MQLIIAAPAGPSPAITSSLTANGMVAQNFVYAITANNNPVGYSSGTLPPGLLLDVASGIISGIPTQSGSYTNIAFTGSSPAGNANAYLTINITAEQPVITSGTSDTATVGVPYFYNISAIDNPTSYTASPLPLGLEVNPATGDIIGVPTTPGTYSIALSAITSGTGASSGTGTSTLNLTVVNNGAAIPTITNPWIVYSVSGSSVSYPITTVNNPTSYACSGSVPGMTFNSITGVLSGTAATVGTYLLDLSAANSTGTATAQLLYVVESTGSGVPATIALQAGVSPFPPHSATSATILNDTSDATSPNEIEGGISVGNYSRTEIERGLIGFDVSMLPRDATSISGSLTLYGTNGSGASQLQLYQESTLFYPGVATWSANSGTGPLLGSLEVSGSDVAVTGTLNTNFATAIQNALSNVTPLQFMLLDGTAEANISGTSYTYKFADEGDGSSGNHPLLTINYTTTSPPVIVPGKLHMPPLGRPLVTRHRFLTARPLSAARCWGLSIDSSTGIINGSASTTGTYTVTLSASNANGIGNGAMTIITGSLPSISSGSTATGNYGTSFNYTVTTSDGPATFTSSGLPYGLALDPNTGIISGSLYPNYSNFSNSVTINATNAYGTTTSILTINAPPLVSNVSGAGNQNMPYFQGLYVYGAGSISETGLPPGLSIGSGTVSGTVSGSISSILTSTGTFNATITAINGSGTSTGTDVIIIAPEALTLTGTLTGILGVTSSATPPNVLQVVAANSGTAPVTSASFTVSGSMDGLSMDSSGNISGTATSVGTYTPTIAVTEVLSSGSTVSGTGPVTIIIYPREPLITGSTSVTGYAGADFEYTFGTLNNSATDTNICVTGSSDFWDWGSI